MKEALFTPEHAALNVAAGSKLYRPSNGSEGEMFRDRWCDHCTKDDYDNEVYCPILSSSMCFETSDKNYPRELKHDEKGQPCCTAFESKGTP